MGKSVRVLQPKSTKLCSELRTKYGPSSPDGATGLMPEEEEAGPDSDDEEDASRRCTDPFCLIVFVGFLAGMGYIFKYAVDYGNVNKVTHGFDWEGRICSVDSGVEDKPVVYWCASETTHADGKPGFELSDPICVEDCPTGASTTHRCPGKPGFNTTEVNQPDGSTRRYITIYRDLRYQPDVATRKILGMYCMPSDNDALARQILSVPGVASYSKQIYMAYTAVKEGWVFLVVVAIVAVIIDYAFIICLKFFIRPIVYLFLFCVVLTFIAIGCWGLVFGLTPRKLIGMGIPLPDAYSAWVDANKSRFDPISDFFEPSEDNQVTLALGIISWILLFLFSCFLCHARQAIYIAVTSITKATRAITRMPTLLMQPVWQLLIHFACFAFSLYGLFWIMSLGKVVTTNAMNDPSVGLPVDVQGMYRTFHFTQQQWYMLFAWGFGAVWIYEFVNCFGQYAVAHAVVVRTFMKHSSDWFPLIHGYQNALIYHVGSLAIGSFIMGVLRVFTLVCSYLGRQSGGKDSKPNVVGRILFCCCGCLLECMTHIMELVNETIWVEMALSGRSYVRSAWRVVKVIATNPLTIATVSATVAIVKFMGFVSVVCSGTMISYAVLSNPEQVAFYFSAGAEFMELKGVEGVGKSLQTSNVMGLTVMSGIVCATVSVSFLNVYGMAAQTIAYLELADPETSST